MDAGDVNREAGPITQENQRPRDSRNEPFTHPLQDEKTAEEGTELSRSPHSTHDSIEAPTLHTILSSKEESIATTNVLAEYIASYFEAVQAPQDTPSLPPQDAAMDDNSPTTAPIHGDFGMQVDSASSEGDTDSTMGTEIEGSTVSLRESIYNYVEENGRTYHAYNSGKYNLPNDDAEQERLDLQHHLFALTLGEVLHLAPLPPALHNVLDIGTGTGIWATEFAEQYTSARVIGMDLSPIQALYVPPNCSFEISDFEEPWDYSFKFDYIHGRAMLSCFRSPPVVIQHAFDALRPGGYLELQDPQMPILCVDQTMDGTSLQEWTTVVAQGAEVLGRVVTNSKNYPRYMAEAGFVDIVEKHFYWPLNMWPKGKKEKLVGMWAQQNILDGVDAMSMAILTRGLGWSREKVEMLLVGVRNDVKNHHIHSYIDVIVVYGRKPDPYHVSGDNTLVDSGSASGA